MPTSTTSETSWTEPAHTSAGKQLPPGAYYDQEAADRAVRFFSLLKLVEGEHAGKTFELMPWMEYEIVRPLFGYKREDGRRLYRTMWLEVPRKNAKTTLAAGLAIYGLIADREPGAQVYIGARDRPQARLCFDLARKIIEASPHIASRCQTHRSYIQTKKNGNVLRALSGDAPGQHGLNAHFAILDEVHVHRSRDLWDVLSSSVGARRQPLIIGITTAGVYDPHSIAWEQHSYAIKVASGEIEDPSYLAVIYNAGDDDAPWDDPESWRKANPSLGRTIGETFLEEEARRAKVSPARQTSFKQLYLNSWTREVQRWIDMAAWDACGAERIDRDKLKGRDCYVGLDLSSTTDVSAAVAAFQEEDGSFTIVPHFWLPEADLAERERRDRLPYRQWANEGHLTLTPGNVIDYAWIKDWLKRFADEHRIVELAYDPWNATGLITELADAGMTCVPTRQGFGTMSAPTKELERLIMAGGIRHGGHPVLRAHVDAARVKSDPAGNVKPDKSSSASRIDGLVATIMAINSGMLKAGGPGRSVYEERGIEFA